jgi:hypothetical protein
MRAPEGFARAVSFPPDGSRSLYKSLKQASPGSEIFICRLLQLRRLLLLALAAGLFTVPVAGASGALARTTGRPYLQFLDGAGVAKVRFRGNFLGHVGRGRIVATRNVHVSGCESRRGLSGRLKACRGSDLGFRTPSDARWRLRLRGRGINASGFVRGCMTLDGIERGDPGDFRIGEPLRRWPPEATRYRLGRGC